MAVTWLFTGPGGLEVDGVKVHDRRPEVKLVRAIKTNLCIRVPASKLGLEILIKISTKLNTHLM